MSPWPTDFSMGELGLGRPKPVYGTQTWDREYFTILVSNFRDLLGFEPADTESTFDPWDLVSLKATGLDVLPNGEQNWAWLMMMEYWLSLPKDVVEPVALMHSERGTANYQCLCYSKHASSYFYMIFRHVFPDEWETLPLYSLTRFTKSSLGKRANLHGFCVNTIKDKAQFFDKILEEIFPDGVTKSDWKRMSWGRGHCRTPGGPHGPSLWSAMRKEHWWFPNTEVLFRDLRKHSDRPNTGNFADQWDFILQFQRHIHRDAKGRFTKRSFKRLDHLVYEYGNVAGITNKSKWNRYHVRDWLFEYAFKHYGIVVNRETFPEHATEDELEQIINLRAEDLRHISGGIRVYNYIRENMDDSGNSILKMVQYAWPKYDMTLSRWSRATAGEKRANIMLERVFNYHDEHYVHATHTPLFNEEGNKITYEHLLDLHHHDVKVDGRSDSLRFAFEAQGDYHFIGRSSDMYLNTSRYDATILHYRDELPKAYLEWCVAEGIEPVENYLQYRQQVLDPECRQAIESIGYTPIYLMLSRYAHAVEGVHGDIPIWSGTYVTPEIGVSNYEDRIGLAETFDLQGREDIGDMIRDYYREVIQ